jgi:hypothetical protein
MSISQFFFLMVLYICVRHSTLTDARAECSHGGRHTGAALETCSRDDRWRTLIASHQLCFYLSALFFSLSTFAAAMPTFDLIQTLCNCRLVYSLFLVYRIRVLCFFDGSFT